jgi:multiple sugar transport system ATP-binding protein
VLGALRAAGATTALVGFRPEALELVSDSNGGAGFEVAVRLVEDLGSDAYLYGAIPGLEHTDDEFDVVARITGGQAPRAGETVRLRVKPGGHHLFVPATGERIGP